MILSWNIRGCPGFRPREKRSNFIEEIGLPSRLIPRRIYYGAVGAQKRYFALKLPVAGGAKTVTFAYVDPGHATAVELHSWGAAHGQLWDAIRAKGRRVEVIAIGAELDTVLRADRVLQLWAAAEPGKVDEGLTVKQEIRAISDAIDNRDMEFLAQYGGMGEAGKRYMARNFPKRSSRKGSRLTAIRRTGPPGFRSRFEGPIWGVFRVTGGRMLFVTGTKGGV